MSSGDDPDNIPNDTNANDGSGRGKRPPAWSAQELREYYFQNEAMSAEGGNLVDLPFCPPSC